MISTRSGALVIDTVVCLTLAKWETVSGRFGGYLTVPLTQIKAAQALLRMNLGSGRAGAKPAPAFPNWCSHLALRDDRRWGFTLADVASAAGDAEESKHRSCC